MKILMILMDSKSGMFQYAALLSNALSETNEIFVIAPAGSERSFFSDKVTFIPFPVGDTGRNFLVNTLNVFNLKKFLDTITGINPDIIHFHNPYVIWPCIFFPWLKRYVITISLPDGRLLPGQERTDIVISRRLHLKRADGVIVLSSHDRELVLQEYPAKKCSVIPHGVNPIYLDFRKDNPITHSDVLFFGGLQEYKGLDLLFKAIPQIRKLRPGTIIAIFANGDLSKFPMHKDFTGADDVIIINKFIPHEEVASLFLGTKLVILPYTKTLHSGVIPLAYAFKKPVVATTHLSEQVIDDITGRLVQPDDENALAEAITGLLNNSATIDSMEDQIKRYNDNELQWGRIADTTRTFYDELLKKRRNG